MDRRSLLQRGVALASGVALSGCTEQLGFETRSVWRDPPLVENRPDAVYYPAIVEGMSMYGVAKSNGVGFALMNSFPHRFWNLTGTNKTKVVVKSSDSLHLMASVWDLETNTTLPLDMSVEIRDNGDYVTSTNLWPMISPNMGFHYGDNITLPGEGGYDVTLRVGPLQINRTTPFNDRFTESHTATMSFTFDSNQTYDLDIQRLGDKAGTRGAVELMEMEMLPDPVAPPKKNLPGRLIGEGSSGDANFLATVVDKETRFATDDRSYVIVSPRTPYNQVMLPRMALSATVKRGQESIFQGPLQASLDPELGCYYGAPLDNIEPEDTVTIEIETPPQLSRHDGYETAFIDMPPIEFTV